MKLKKLELQGYKTFASKTVFEFDEGITAIVGPNGSGKSNVADAMRWVLGEQSYSTLRGKRTTDMIFAGSQDRARAGMAAVPINARTTTTATPNAGRRTRFPLGGATTSAMGSSPITPSAQPPSRHQPSG